MAPQTPLDDREWGAFTDDPPWILDPNALDWLSPVAERRRALAREVPTLCSPTVLPPGARFGRVACSIGAALAPWFVARKRGRYPDRSASQADLAERLRSAAERLGPSFIKLGQIVAAGDGLFPAALVSSFKRCRDEVSAEPFDVVRTVIESEIGPIGAVFAHLDPQPLAAASIAQVHAATLLTGQDVVVKVQRPGIGRLVRDDLRAMAWIAPHLVGRIPVAALANPPALVELFAETILEELDFRIEAANMLDLGRVIKQLGQDNYVVPRPHPTLVTERLMVMQRLHGFKFDDVTGMRSAGIDTEAVIRSGMISFMEGAMLHGIFHGDLHGGNLFVLNDGTTALLDFGIVARLTPRRRHAFLRLMLGAITNDIKSQVQGLRDLGALPHDTDLDAVIADLGLDRPPVDPTKVNSEEMIAEIQRIVKGLLAYGARLPKELMLYVKNMIFLDGAISQLAPDLDLLGEAQHISQVFAVKHGARLGKELGVDPDTVEFDFDGMKLSMGLDDDVQRLTYRDLQARRELIRKRMRNNTV